MGTKQAPCRVVSMGMLGSFDNFSRHSCTRGQRFTSTFPPPLSNQLSIKIVLCYSDSGALMLSPMRIPRTTPLSQKPRHPCLSEMVALHSSRSLLFTKRKPRAFPASVLWKRMQNKLLPKKPGRNQAIAIIFRLSGISLHSNP